MADEDERSPEEIEAEKAADKVKQDAVMREQEAMMFAKYGGMKPKKKSLLKAKEHKYFDSADYNMNKEAAANGGPAVPPAQEVLKPKLEPTPLPSRRISHLDPMDKNM